MKAVIVTFPGSNCDQDCFWALKDRAGFDVKYQWHRDAVLEKTDLVVLPGGFSYGDYLRTGALARFSPLMKEVVRFAQKGGAVLGICNGFQILLESGLLPGAMLKNTSLRFICRNIYIKAQRYDSFFTSAISQKKALDIPIAHYEGNYYADSQTLKKIEDNGQVLFRYTDAGGNATPEANPNGSVNNIAGICNEEGNILGMMPHPERAVDSYLQSCDGLSIFQSLKQSLG